MILLAKESCAAILCFAAFNQMNFQYIFKGVKTKEEVLPYSINHLENKKPSSLYAAE